MKLKVCGMKIKSNIVELAKLYPDFMGFIFHEPSSRFFDAIIPDLPQSIKKIGVFVDASVESIIETVKKHNLNGVQLHGSESTTFISVLKQKALELKLNLTYIKVFALDNTFNFKDTLDYENTCDYFLFDSKGPLPGGNGYAFNWKVIDRYKGATPFILSGGIGMDQINQLKEFKASESSKLCVALDVNSQFEIAPGHKDIDNIKTFKKFSDEL